MIGIAAGERERTRNRIVSPSSDRGNPKHDAVMGFPTGVAAVIVMGGLRGEATVAAEPA